MNTTINFNGKIFREKKNIDFYLESESFFRSIMLSEKIIVIEHNILFSEAHYFNLMAALRICRIEIPLYFTPEFFEAQIQNLIEEFTEDNLSIHFQIFYNENKLHYLIQAFKLNDFYTQNTYSIELYREAYVGNNFFDRINFFNPLDSILGVYCEENELQDLFLQNNNKQLAKTLRGNLFLIEGNKLLTPRIEDGAKDSVLRAKITSTARKMPEFDLVQEVPLFPFAITKADELFVAIDGEGITSVRDYKKTKFETEYTQAIVHSLLEQLV